jgi:Chaperone of endosialidase
MTLDGIDKPTNKRPNYFAGQYLLEYDFQDEQQYHIDRQRRHNRLLHVSGIAEGLIVSKASGLTVKITKGTAIDNQGRQIVQLEDIEALNLLKIAGDGIKQGDRLKDENYILSVGYSCELSKEDKQGEDEIRSTRLVEIPQFKLSLPAELKDFIPLAKITINSNAVKGDINNSDRVYSGLRLPSYDGEITLISKSDGNKIAELKGSLSIVGTLSVTDNVGIGTPPNSAAKLQVKIDAATTTASLKLEHNGSNFIVRPVSAGGTSSVIENTGGGSLSINPNGGNVGIGTTDPKQQLVVNIGKASIGYNDAQQTAAFAVNGNVGIGTTDPGASKLKISNSASDFADISFSGSGMGQLQVIGWSSGWNINTITPGKHLYLNRDSGENSDVYIGRKGKELFVRGSDGNVGIGTTNPKGFQIVLPESSKSSSLPSAGVTIAGGASGNASIELRNAGTGTPYIDFAQNATTTDFDARIRLTEPGKLAIEGTNVGIGTTSPTEKLEISGGNLKVSGNLSGTNARLTGNVGIGATPGMTDYLDVNSKIGTNASLVVASKTPNLVEKLVNQTKTFDLAKTESVLTLVRDGVSGQSWSNIVDFRIGRYEKSNENHPSRTQLDILLAHRDLEEKKEDTKLQRVMTLRSNGYVSIGIPSPTKNYTIEFTGSANGNASLKVDNVPPINMQTQGLNTVILNADGTVKHQQNHDKLSAEFLWNDWAIWVNKNADNGDIVAVVKSSFAFFPQSSGEAADLLRSIGATKAFESHTKHYVLLFIKGRIGVREELQTSGSNAPLITTYELLLEFTSSPNNPTTLDVNGLLKTQKLQLGSKFLLSGDRVPGSNDEWLSLRNLTQPQVISGGFAAGKLWSSKGSLEPSDVQMKKDIRNLSKVLDKVLSLRGISFQWKDSQSETLPRLGMIAQEVETVFPELVEMGPNNMKAINYTGFIAILIEAIKEQQQQIEKLSVQISE